MCLIGLSAKKKSIFGLGLIFDVGECSFAVDWLLSLQTEDEAEVQGRTRWRSMKVLILTRTDL